MNSEVPLPAEFGGLEQMPMDTCIKWPPLSVLMILLSRVSQWRLLLFYSV